MKKYTKDHEWLSLADGVATVGISDHAQETLGDVVFVELPEIGQSFKQGDAAGIVESVKAAADVYMPVSGEIVAVNENIVDQPEIINKAAESDAWFFKIKCSKPEEMNDLLDADAYNKLIG